MAYTDYFDDVQKLYIAYYQRPADPGGLRFWANQLDGANGDVNAVVDRFATSSEAVSLYDTNGDGVLDNSDDYGELVQSIYWALFDRLPDDDGLDYYVTALQNGQFPDGRPATPGRIALDILNGARNEDYVAIANKLQTADAFTQLVDGREYSDPYFGTGNDFNVTYKGENDAAAAREFLAGVTSESSTVPSQTTVTEFAKTIADDGDPILAAPPSVSVRLTTGYDEVIGSTADDHFIANVVQNADGAQVNTLGSGDIIDGGAGTDTLDAKVTSGVFAGGGITMPIQPEIKNVENINFQAVIADIGQNGNNDVVFINGKDITDISNISSVHSDASLVLQNLTTERSDGTIGKLSDITVGMKYSGNSDHLWHASNLDVYFDQDYLRPEITRTNPAVDFRLMNEDSYDFTNGERPLDGVYIAQMAFTLNGKQYDLAPYIQQIEPPTGAGNEIVNYEDLLAAVQQAIEGLKADHPEDAALQTLTTELNGTFRSDISPITGEWREGLSVRLSVAGITNGTANTLVSSQEDLTINRAPLATIDNNNRYERADTVSPIEGQKLAINIDLEKVGLGGDGGHLIIGSMFKDGTNTWSDTYAGKGIEEFDVTVRGGSDKPSSLSQLASTGNNLRTVKVVTDPAQTDSYANLTIGNSNTEGTLGTLTGNANALKDVQTFDATGFKGDLTLYAALTGEIIAKYMNTWDGAPELAPADNQLFKYDGGSGNDIINLAISSDNLAWESGTTTREDFNLEVNGNDGNDLIVVSVQNGDVLDSGAGAAWYQNSKLNANLLVDGSAGAAWYQNSKLNANLLVDGSAGNDIIAVLGSGDYVVKGGTGNDAIYVGSSAARDDDPNSIFKVTDTRWVFNTADQTSPDEVVTARNTDNLLSDTNDTYAGIYKAKLTVAYDRNPGDNVDGYTSHQVVVSSNTTNFNTTDLDINQAIKAAINDDPVLSKLLVAYDGPGNTLVVDSIIDGGAVTGSELIITLTAPNANELTMADVNAYNTRQGTAITTTEGLALEIGNRIAAANIGDNDYASALANDGTNLIGGSTETHVADNHIFAGAGNDVIVLGMTANDGEPVPLTDAAGSVLDVDLLSSNDTLVFDQPVGLMSNGADTVVNFSVEGNGIDYLDFRSYFTNATLVVAQDGTALVGTLPTAAGQHYIDLVQTGANTGIYEIQYHETGATDDSTDDVVTVIGTIDFGQTVDLTAANIVQ